MHIRRPLYIVLAWVLSAAKLTEATAQDSLHTPGHVSISSPNAASLGKYGDIPVGYHTGTPQISIPLYTVKAGNLSLPIGLSYHASGLKVLEPASWVGAGWSLNAGGVITRTVMGLPDERGTNAGSVELKGHFSEYGYNNYMYESGQEDWLGFGAGRKDGEPDLFFFNFGGYTGKFFFRDDRTPVLVPQQDLKIVPYYPADTASFANVNGGGSIQGFTVTTPDGTQYFFGRTPGFTGTAPIEVTNAYTSQAGAGGSVISGWYLNKIQSADGQFSINLNYTQENYGYFTLSTFPINPLISQGMWGSPYEYNLVKNLIAGVRLSSITFPNGTVSLSGGAVRTDLSSDYPYAYTDSTNTQAMTLGSIQVADSGTFCKKYKFFYGYFVDSTTGQPGYYGTPGVFTLFTDKKRLRLDSVQEITCDSALSVPPYKFGYYTEKVPRRITFAQDHWGFYNGATSNSKMIPTYTLNGSVVNGASRDASWPEMRGGALTQITYPTGGTTHLNFEPHSLNSYHYLTGTGTLVNLVANMYGQNTDTAAGNFTTDGTLITLDLNNTSTYTAYFKVTDGSNAVVYNTSIGNNTHLTFTFTLAAGTYHATTYIPIAPQYAGGGLQALLLQTITDTTLSNIVVGGLRIQSVVTNDGLGGPTMTTSYGYTNPSGMSTGVLYSIPTYVQQVRNDLIANIGYNNISVAGSTSFVVDVGNINGCPSANGGDYFVSGGSIRPMEAVQGNHIGYQTVTVSQSGNGYSVYNYYTTTSGYSGIVPDVCVRTATIGSGCLTSTPNFPSAPAPFDYKRGELYYEQHYTNNGQLLKDMYYYPVFDTTSVLPTPAFIVQPHNTGGSNLLLGTKYQLSTVRKVKMMTVEDDYNAAGGGYVTKTNTVYYGSAFHNQPTRTVSSTATGDSLVQNVKYAFDFRIPGCDSISDCSQAYTSTCATCQSTYSSAQTACAGDIHCAATAFLSYLQCLTTARISYDSCRKVNYMNPSNLFATCHTNARNAGDTWLKPVMRLQDMYDNAPIEASDFKNTNLLHASFTKYDSSTIPLGVAYPGRTQLINLVTPSGSFSAAAVSGNTINRDSRYLDESSYQFNAGNPQQVTAHDGVPISYIWDYRNTQPIAKVSNATVDQIAYTSFEADGNGGWTIASPARDTFAITGRESYNLSYGACSRVGLSSGKAYTLSYWSKTGSSFTVSGAGPAKQGKTVNGWTYFQHNVAGVTSVSVSGTGDIDELRLYPSRAQMTTYTYQPLVGMTSQCDIGNRITYYEYDGLQRLKRIRDQDYNILKSLDYQYQQSSGCGSNCYILTMETLAGTNTLGYPVGVFNVHGKLLGNADSAGQYVSLWNADTADSHVGTLAKGGDPLHFNMTLNSGQILPSGVTGCRYYQVDLAWNVFDGVRNGNAAYVDFGDSIGMRLPTSLTAVAATIPARTIDMVIGDGEIGGLAPYYIHTYPDTTLKTLTFYHNDDALNDHLDNATGPAISLTKLKHFRGNLPQNLWLFGSSSYQQASMNSVDSIYNWSSIHNIIWLNFNNGDRVNPGKNMTYAQDFMQYNKGLQAITTLLNTYRTGYRDTTFKISRLKSDWNTYFTQLRTLAINDDHWNREDLSALHQLNLFILSATTQNHQDDPNSPLLPIPQPVIDSIFIQIAAGAGQTVSNGTISLVTGGPTPGSAGQSAIQFLLSKGWFIYINGVLQTNP